MSQFKETEFLKEMRALIQVGWCQLSMAQDSEGNNVSSKSMQAVSFCLMGAYEKTASKFAVHGVLYFIRRALYNKNFTNNLPNFNDHPERKVEEVIDLLDRAILLSEKV